ncbi:MAG: nitroreductase family protein [Ruminococcus sp.]|uniref:nitroreductase family protein n=1 Tax=Ruminococcus sp. TaxID=41978 RepID=UPI0025FC089C|nr:nitroreductase family protein [Ruminococcus sp.]MCR4793864.1 nitroreductase family protein [Ruminococcus sp.]
MDKIISACGNDCSACPRYIAAPYEKTEEELRHTAELWLKIGYRDRLVSNGEISCNGCKPENWCRYGVIKCCKEKAIRNCSECSDFPCDNMKECFAVTKSFEPKCREVCTDPEYEQLKTAFFEKEKNLLAQRNLQANNMDIFDIIRNRTIYRGKYINAPIPKADLVKILEAGAAAPSGCNKQTASFIAVDDTVLLKEIKLLIEPPIAETAPAFILVLTQRIFAYRDKCYNIQDYSAAIENMLLAIKALGYESCWYEGHITDDDDIAGKIAAHMGIPDDYSIVCILPVGKPAEKTHQAVKKPFESRIWFNGFGKSSLSNKDFH